MAGNPCPRYSATNERGADATIAMGRMDSQRSEQHGGSPRPGADMPQPDRTDETAVFDRDQR